MHCRDSVLPSMAPKDASSWSASSEVRRICQRMPMDPSRARSLTLAQFMTRHRNQRSQSSCTGRRQCGSRFQETEILAMVEATSGCSIFIGGLDDPLQRAADQCKVHNRFSQALLLTLHGNRCCQGTELVQFAAEPALEEVQPNALRTRWK